MLEKKAHYSSLMHPMRSAIASQLFVFTAGDILKGITNNFSGLNNEANHF
ncbi:hypothetical protein [Tumidithrix helvetica]